jgi:hypothetical protein
MDVAKPKGLRLKRWQKKQLWIWRIAQKSEASRQAYAEYYECLKRARRATRLKQTKKKKLQRQTTLALSKLYQTQASYLKHCRRLQRYAKRGQLINGELYCRAGKKITQERVDRYEAMCHFMVRKFLPGLALWEASMSYDDLVNQCRMEIYLALLNGFNPKSVMKKRDRTDQELEDELLKLEKTIVYGRLKSCLRRMTWRNHPDQLGGKTWCLEQILNREDACSEEFRYGLFTKEHGNQFFPIDFIRDQQDRLLEILNQYGPEAAKEVFSRMDQESKELIQESLFGNTKSKWSELADLGGDDSCSSE